MKALQKVEQMDYWMADLRAPHWAVYLAHQKVAWMVAQMVVQMGSQKALRKDRQWAVLKAQQKAAQLVHWLVVLLDRLWADQRECQ